MSDLTERIERAIECSIRINYDDALEQAEESAGHGEYKLGWKSRSRLIKYYWGSVAPYAGYLKKARRLAERHSFLEWDEERAQRIDQTAKVNIVAKITEDFPSCEATGQTKKLSGILNIIKYLEGSI